MTKAKAMRALSRAGRNVRELGDVDELLEHLGLERKQPMGTFFGGLGFFALGLLVGSAIGLILAPMTGNEMRSILKDQGVRGMVERTRSPMPTA